MTCMLGDLQSINAPPLGKTFQDACGRICNLDGVAAVLAIAGRPTWRRAVREELGEKLRWQEVRHSLLGGLTQARIEVGWNQSRQTPAGVAPGSRRAPLRPLGRFLEPSLQLGEWRWPSAGTNCWRPTQTSAKPFPWPLQAIDPWVEAPTVYRRRRVGAGEGPAMIERPLTTKERSQLLDLQETWGHKLTELVWEWDQGMVAPVRLLSETLLELAPWAAVVWDIPEKGLESETDLSDVAKAGALKDAPVLEWIWEEVGEVIDSVATKSDDADIDLTIWSGGGVGVMGEAAREVLRRFLWVLWVKRLAKEAREWLRTPQAQADYLINRDAIRDCIRRCTGSSWWDWNDGSRLLFWRWPSAWMVEARDGAKGLHIGFPRPRLQYPQVPMTEAWIVEKDAEKLEKLLRRRYLVVGPCRNTVPRFPVPKGTDDIRVVWDLAKNGVNEGLYTPSFFLPTMATYLRRLEAGMYSGDFDVAEQFHNYMLHPAEQVYAGVHIPSPLVQKLEAEGLAVAPIMRWSRLVFGWQSSPYLALRMLSRMLEIAKGDPTKSANVFGWEKVELNLPGMSTYDPGRLRVCKLRSTGLAATELVVYFDDGRVFGPTLESTTLGLRQCTARMQWMGNQDAARKRRKPTQRPGAWAGGIAYTDRGVTRKTVSQLKWDKVKEYLRWVDTALRQSDFMDRKRFRSGKGFLLHVAQTFDFVQPYLKGFHLADDAWRPHRGADGWKLAPKDWTMVAEKEHSEMEEQDLLCGVNGEQPVEPSATEPPIVITNIPPRLRYDVDALLTFFGANQPVQMLVRPFKGATSVVYGAGDASGEGFGSQTRLFEHGANIRRGFWCTESSEQSSNWREMRNLVDAITLEAKAGRLLGKELWIGTDNSTAASAYHKGSSKSKLLHGMVTELRMLSLTHLFLLHVYHIAGTRMIEIGVDALSRGELHTAALETMVLSAAPLHLSPLQRSPGLQKWLEGWLGEQFKVAGPSEWLYEAQQGGQHDDQNLASETWVWDLPPAAALYALEELGGGRLKRHNVLRGVILIPNLLVHEWHRRLGRISDFYFVLAPGAIPEWPASGPRGTGGESPLWYHSASRCQRCTRKVTHAQGIFCANYGMHVDGLPLCQRAWCPTCYTAHAGTVFSIYHITDEAGNPMMAPGEERDFLEGRAGDHLYCPFECDGCAFHRLRGMEPVKGSQADDVLLAYIRRANLDAFWSRRPGTVVGLTRLFKEQVAVGDSFGFQMLPALGPFSYNYDSGMKAAIGILSRSQRPGRHEATMKFSSVRKARALHTDVYAASAMGSEGAMVWRSEKTRFVATKSPTDSTWFTYFMKGYRARVGERRKQDAALTVDLMLFLQCRLEAEWALAVEARNMEAQRNVAEHGAFYLFLFCASLRGFEGSKVVLGDLRRQIVSPTSPRAGRYLPHVGLSLSGRFKARSQEQQSIMIPVAYKTASGLEPGKWAERLVGVLQSQQVTMGWAFQDQQGGQLSMSHFEERFYDILSQAQIDDPTLFAEGCVVAEDYHLGRSFRRGATTRATNAGVTSADIEWVNRWNVGADQTSAGVMRVLYADRLQLLDTFLRFSAAL